MLNIKAFLSSLPNQPGVYQMLGTNGEILYVGKARDLKKRVSSYFLKSNPDLKTQALMKHVVDINVTITHSENDALLLECNLIKKHKPHYNVIFRDDKSYPYILITKEKFPRIDLYRGAKKGEGMYFGPYPSASAVRETIHVIQKLFQLRTCSDGFFTSRQRPCLQHQIGRCSGPCGDLISPAEYQRNVQHTVLFLQGKSQLLIEELTKRMEHFAKELNFEAAANIRDQILKLRQIQANQYVSGGHGEVDVIGFATSAGMACIQLLIIRGGRILGSRAYYPSDRAGSSPEEVIISFIAQHYLGAEKNRHEIPKEIILGMDLSEAAWLSNALSDQSGHKVALAMNVRGERNKWLEIANTSAKQSLASRLLDKGHTKERFDALQKILNLKQLPKRIECFDISHSMGEETVGSCVVFNINGPAKSDYRRFNITGITPGDDFAAMQQVLSRRFKRQTTEQEKMPDILLIDGGKPQLSAAQKALLDLNVKDILLIGVAKGVTRKPGFETLYIVPDESPIHLPPDSPALHLIQQIRDEAHRFAITGHRNRRDKKRVTSTLEAIPGIGAKRRRELLRYFGGIQAINRASLEELAKVPGISQSLAERIFTALHDVTI
ncbi:MAG: excinuclease ABC subunit UvrC [Gammaproteobacteria bacterium]